jgi:hypothetical protein
MPINPSFFLQEGNRAPADGNTYVQLLGGPDQEMTPVTVCGGTGVFHLVPNVHGFFDAGLGRVWGVGPNEEAQFQLRAWRNAASFAAADEKGVSEVFTNPTGSSGGLGPPNPAPLVNLPSVIIVPEPAPYLLGLIGVGALLLFRHRV